MAQSSQVPRQVHRALLVLPSGGALSTTTDHRRNAIGLLRGALHSHSGKRRRLDADAAATMGKVIAAAPYIQLIPPRRGERQQQQRRLLSTSPL